MLIVANLDPGTALRTISLRCLVTSLGFHAVAVATLRGGTLMQGRRHELANKIRMPQNGFHLHEIRPDLVLFHVVARGLILWSQIQASHVWVVCQLPAFLHLLPCDMPPPPYKSPSMRMFDQPFECDRLLACQTRANILAGCCWLVGLKFAGTGDPMAVKMLWQYLYWFKNIRPLDPAKFPSVLASVLQGPALARFVTLDKYTQDCCKAVVYQSLACVLAGTGDVTLFKMLQDERDYAADSELPYGYCLSILHSLGLLFLGGGQYTLKRDPISVALLFVSLYPKLPQHSSDNRHHLQALRHLSTLAAERRCLEAIDLETGNAVEVAVELSICDSSTQERKVVSKVLPCLIPELSSVESIQLCSPQYMPLMISTRRCDLFRNILLFGRMFVQRRADGSLQATSNEKASCRKEEVYEHALRYFESSFLGDQNAKCEMSDELLPGVKIDQEFIQRSLLFGQQLQWRTRNQRVCGDGESLPESDTPARECGCDLSVRCPLRLQLNDSFTAIHSFSEDPTQCCPGDMEALSFLQSFCYGCSWIIFSMQRTNELNAVNNSSNLNPIWDLQGLIHDAVKLDNFPIVVFQCCLDLMATVTNLLRKKEAAISNWLMGYMRNTLLGNNASHMFSINGDEGEHKNLSHWCMLFLHFYKFPLFEEIKAVLGTETSALLPRKLHQWANLNKSLSTHHEAQLEIAVTFPNSSQEAYEWLLQHLQSFVELHFFPN